MVDTVVIKSADQVPQEDQAHIDAMVAKVDASNAPPADPSVDQLKPTKPEWVPEKFWDAEKGEVRIEDLAKSYGELEGKLGAPNKGEPGAAPNAAEGQPTDAPAQDDAQAQLADKGLNLDEFSAEFAKNGDLSAESYEKLKKAGFNRTIVDQYIAGQRAIATQYQADIKSVAGGDDGFGKMVEWAKTNASPEEITAYNKAIDSGDVNTAKLAVAGMFQKYQDANPTEPSLVTGRGGAPAADVYESIQDYLKDSRNPEYKSNPAFRAKVIAKLGRSDIL
ncbi:head assembly [Ralstonia phage BOESR1]|uniref:Head assembly n=1 Tax=Ralstonia phage BOESR1 TaxID=3034917 RepID=A0AA50IEB3_9CAUD|nr:head assembly [Ralstonia phage BOESR1]WLW40605.1 head assembly [Ralstonia phage BOESR1]